MTNHSPKYLRKLRNRAKQHLRLQMQRERRQKAKSGIGLIGFAGHGWAKRRDENGEFQLIGELSR